MTKPYWNLLIIFFQLTWFQINCFGSGCANRVFKASKAERNLLQCLQRLWGQVSKSRRVKRLCSFLALVAQQSSPHKLRWVWYIGINYTILSEKATATLVIIKKVRKQLVTTNGWCFTTPPEERNRKSPRGEQEPVCSQMATCGYARNGTSLSRAPDVHPDAGARHWFAIQSSFFRHHMWT